MKSNAKANGGFTGLLVHELAHSLLQFSDPVTCQRHSDIRSNPLVQRWARETAGEQPPTNYGRTDRIEDMADSLMAYLGDRATLRSIAPLRAQFYDDLLARVGAKPPDELQMQPIVYAATNWFSRANADSLGLTLKPGAYDRLVRLHTGLWLLVAVCVAVGIWDRRRAA